MSVLAFKALSVAADKIPDRIFESLPGGYFTPGEKKKTKTNRRPLIDNRDNRSSRSEHRHSERDRRRSHRERTPPTDYSDASAYDDTDYEKEYRKQRRRRARSLGGNSSRSRSYSRGRHHHRNLDGQQAPDMDRSDRGRGGPDFPPPPTSEYKPYNPADYAAPAAGAAAAGVAAGTDYYDRRTSSARPDYDYGYPSQVNTAFRPRLASAPLLSPLGPLPLPPMGMNRPPSNLSYTPFSSTLNALTCPGSPFQTLFSPSYEPPAAYLLQQSGTNSPQPRPGTGHSSFAARYTPSAGYNPSPVNASVPPPNPGYTPYNPAEYAYTAPGNTYASPPPFYRQESRSQPSLAPNSNNQMAPYNDAYGRHGSTSSSRRRHHHQGDDKVHRARSADHRRSRSRVTDQVRDRFDSLDTREKDLAASAAGALAGGLVGHKLGHGTLSTLVGAAIGGLGGRELEKRHEKKKATRSASRASGQREPDRSRSRHRGRNEESRSPSRDRQRVDRFEEYSDDSDYDDRRGSSRRRKSSRKRRDSDY
ncbi:hypothetical protein EJ04DRAFT_518315 [Polyplosphaeria fusca]|uniref:Glycine zipper 2TM domain-containing protein n=1 Tax=Polyplosphaeria fusca TaxID=682080 RepID=A0A9P4RAG5_9PLEO|nr:hypothetical protein EJ04DRAFT_518315 [Polyplosphaeria fusca]